MTRRYFYSDPLAAAWMAKHFGMKLDGALADVKVGMVTQQWRRISDFYAAGKYYIHPDSEPLLEAKIGDCCEWNGCPDERHYSAFCIEDDDQMLRREVIAIVARNGIPFMEPESEEA